MQGRPRPSDSKAPMKLKADTTRAVGLTNHRSAEHAGGDAMTNGWRSVPALEGVVAKWEHGTYQIDGRGTSWLKIKNPDYSQIVGRPELFDAQQRLVSPVPHTNVRPELRLVQPRLRPSAQD
jgi:hypothetical protein